MTATGYLSEYSLPELLHLLEVGNRTGQLKLCSQDRAGTSQTQHYFIWFRQGRIVSAFNDLRGRNLVRLMHQRQLLNLETATTLLRRSPVDLPFGLFLKSKRVLNADQLQLLFSIQVVRQIRALFTLEDAWFKFRDDAELPYSEMTGISIKATEVILPGLRALRNWKTLESRLPHVESGLSRCVSQPTVRLKAAEQQVWALADGESSLQAIANRLDQTLPELQRIAFCLINAGLVEEVPLATLAPTTDLMSSLSELEPAASASSTAGVSHAFLESLEQYLKSHA